MVFDIFTLAAACLSWLGIETKVENVSSTALRPIWGLVRKAVRPLIPVQTTLKVLQRHTAMSLLMVKSRASRWERGPALTRRAPGTWDSKMPPRPEQEPSSRRRESRMAKRNHKKTLVNEIASSQWSRSSRCCLNNQNKVASNRSDVCWVLSYAAWH